MIHHIACRFESEMAIFTSLPVKSRYVHVMHFESDSSDNQEPMVNPTFVYSYFY